VQAHAPAFEDFWNRQRGDSFFGLDFPAYGYQVRFRTNARPLLDAARLSAPRHPHAAPLAGEPVIELHVEVVPGWQAGSPPSDLPARIQTVGSGDLLLQSATPWLQWYADLNARRAFGWVAPSLVQEGRLVSRYLVDRAITNILIREGVGGLHATSLLHADHAVIFIAPHGTGKSTTAFHLLNCGYRLMGDGLLYLRERDGQLELMGYPVGEAKLTAEMRPLFPEWRGAGSEVTVHNVLKTIVDLRDLAPGKVVEDAVTPNRLILCLAERDADTTTRAELLAPEAALVRLLPDTLHWDAPAPLMRSLGVVRRMVERAACYRLTLGRDPEELIETIVGLAAR
jgi:hypothetical protein